jgi:hypothetical protein
MGHFTNYFNGSQNKRNPGMPTYQVTAFQAGSALSFSLPDEDTFAELADLLDHLGARHIGEPTAIYLKLGASGRPVCILQPGF